MTINGEVGARGGPVGTAAPGQDGDPRGGMVAVRAVDPGCFGRTRNDPELFILTAAGSAGRGAATPP